MAAYIRVITDPGKWAVILEFLNDCEEGAIVIGPQAAAAFEKKYHVPIEEGMVEYDYGECCDLMLDWINDDELFEHYCWDAVRAAAGLPSEEPE